MVTLIVGCERSQPTLIVILQPNFTIHYNRNYTLPPFISNMRFMRVILTCSSLAIIINTGKVRFTTYLVL